MLLRCRCRRHCSVGYRCDCGRDYAHTDPRPDAIAERHAWRRLRSTLIRERNAVIRARRANGETLQAIATSYQITRERVRQLCRGIACTPVRPQMAADEHP